MVYNVVNVLLLEDEPLIAIDLETTLNAQGFAVSIATSCAGASRVLESHRPDVVVVDIELRDGPCTDVAASLVEENIPFVIYSGELPSFHIDTPFARGTWIEKPALAGELVAAVRAALRGRRLQADVGLTDMREELCWAGAATSR